MGKKKLTGRKILNRVKLGTVLGLSIMLFVMVAQNAIPVTARFLWFTGEVSAVVLLIISAATGFILGLLVALFTRRRTRSSEDSENGKPDS